jgi:hypothetical protein
MVVGPNAIAGSWGYTIGNQESQRGPQPPITKLTVLDRRDSATDR